jgi:8-oxo-dGTP pyrophosphatase MutT (NUDIX family)
VREKEELSVPELGVTVVVIRDNAVLLTKREDFDVWCLPGGAVDAREPLDHAARREVWEETGIEISITRLIGIYTNRSGGRAERTALSLRLFRIPMCLLRTLARLQILAIFRASSCQNR